MEQETSTGGSNIRYALLHLTGGTNINKNYIHRKLDHRVLTSVSDIKSMITEVFRGYEGTKGHVRIKMEDGFVTDICPVPSVQILLAESAGFASIKKTRSPPTTLPMELSYQDILEFASQIGGGAAADTNVVIKLLRAAGTYNISIPGNSIPGWIQAVEEGNPPVVN